MVGTARDNYTERRGHDVEPFTDIFADNVALRAAATGHIVGRGHLSDTRQMLWQEAASRAWSCRGSCLWCIDGFIFFVNDGHGRLDVFQRKMILIRMTLFGHCAKERPFDAGEPLLKPDEAILFAHIPLL